MVESSWRMSRSRISGFSFLESNSGELVWEAYAIGDIYSELDATRWLARIDQHRDVAA